MQPKVPRKDLHPPPKDAVDGLGRCVRKASEGKAARAKVEWRGDSTSLGMDAGGVSLCLPLRRILDQAYPPNKESMDAIYGPRLREAALTLRFPSSHG